MNPRHTPKDDQEHTITYLIGNEEVYNLARHIAHNGLNPLEVIAVFPDEDGNLIAAEGNRRLCAAQLLTDPEKAPDSTNRKRFHALAKDAKDVSEINVAIFPDYDSAQPWLQVLHDGEQDGVGRRKWKPEQKSRATTSRSKDSLAVQLLDHATSSGILSLKDRPSVRISTVTRYLANPKVRSALGLASSASSDSIELVGEDHTRFNDALKDFLDQILVGRLHSRSKSEDWEHYADEVIKKFGPAPIAETSTVDFKPPAKAATAAPASRSSRVKIVQPNTTTILSSPEVVTALNELASPKLSGLYRSLTVLRLDEHPALLTTGAWAFFEVLTALHGRYNNSDFVSYLNGLSSKLGFSKDQWKICRTSLEEIQALGNAEKHEATFTALQAHNLHNRFEVLESLIFALITECNSAKPSMR